MELIGQDEALLGEDELRERVRELEGLCAQLRAQVAQMEKTVAQAQGERDRFQALYQRALAHTPRRPQGADPQGDAVRGDDTGRAVVDGSATPDRSATLDGLGEAMAQRGEIIERAVARAKGGAQAQGEGRLL